jgi:hypothetical protein
VKYSNNDGLRAGVAIGAVIIIVAAVLISKRRSRSLTGIGAEQEAARAPSQISGLPPAVG